jgi:DNA-binding CsgD family transcriptional regulator
VDLDSLDPVRSGREAFLREVLLRATEGLGAECGVFYGLRNGDGEPVLRAEVSVGRPVGGQAPQSIPLRSRSWAGRALDEAGAVAVAHEDGGALGVAPEGVGPAGSGICARVGSRRRKVYGLLLIVCSGCRGFEPEEAGFLVDLAHKVGDAIERQEEREREIGRLNALLADAEDRAQDARRQLLRERDIVNALVAAGAPLPPNAPSPGISEDRGALTDPLTDRESEVLRLLNQGLHYEDVADALFVTPHTVRKHLRTAALKLGTEGRHKTLARARSLRLV